MTRTTSAEQGAVTVLEPGDLRLPRDVTAVRVARHWAAARARGRHLEDPLVRTVELLTSELASNAVKYGLRGLFVLQTFTAGPAYGVCVRDHSAERPRVLDAPPHALGGRGLRLVAMLSTAWGVTPADDGKAVWFLVRPPAPAPAPAA